MELKSDSLILSYKDLLFSYDPLVTILNNNHNTFAKLFGVPFDFTSTYRPGSRFAPNAIRESFMNIELFSPNFGIDLENLSFQDLGNLNRTANIDKMQNNVEKVASEIISENYSVGILGGEHSISYGAFKSLPPDVGIIIFDAHFDLRDTYEDLTMSHATYLRRYIEKFGCNHIIHMGARAGAKEEWDYIKNYDLTVITDQTIKLGDSYLILKDYLKDFSKIYVSVDMDVIDPSSVPGVGNPEPNGISIEKLLKFFNILQGKNIIGFDIVEVCPPYDTGISSIVAAKCLCELLTLSYLGHK